MDPRRWMRTGIAVVLAVKLAGLLPLAAVAVGAGEGGVRSSGGAAPARTGTPGTSPAVSGSGSTTTASKPPPAVREPEPMRIPGDGPSAEFDAESRGVRELVEVLRRRDEELARRDAELARREAAIAAAAKDLNDKIVHLEALTGTAPPAEGLARAGAPAVPGSGAAVARTGGGGDGRGAGVSDGAGAPLAAVDSMEELGKIYGAMKAEEAAPLFDRLDDATVLRIFQHMKQRQISAVLPLMKPEKAVTLTELLGGRRPATAARAAAASPATPATTR